MSAEHAASSRRRLFAWLLGATASATVVTAPTSAQASDDTDEIDGGTP